MRFRRGVHATRACFLTLVVGAVQLAGCSASSFTTTRCKECPDTGPGPDAGTDATSGGAMGPDAASGGPDAAASDAPGSSCPTAGAAMVRITIGVVNFCIDRAEVTNDQYNAFYQSAASAPSMAPRCQKSVDAPPMSGPLPVTNVDWCSAFSFCKWAGKRLCGRIGGGALTEPLDRVDPQRSEWVYACSNSGATHYPYQDTYDATRCHGTGTRPVALDPNGDTCQGGFPGIFDMSGNVEEWIDACTVADLCVSLGGAYDDVPQHLTCYSESATVLRTGRSPKVGFRCCAD